jgi:hypothetical protein
MLWWCKQKKTVYRIAFDMRVVWYRDKKKQARCKMCMQMRWCKREETQNAIAGQAQ